MVALPQIIRKITHQMQVGKVLIGGGLPVVVQSMTDTDTADINSTVKQIIELAEAGSEIVRLTINTDKAAMAIIKIKKSLSDKGLGNIPLVGDFHYNGHVLLTKYPECAQILDKYRINPGNVGFGEKHDIQFKMMIDVAIKYNKPVRIGVNWGSLDQHHLTQLMDRNSKLPNPKEADEVLRQALIISALSSAKKAIDYGLPSNKICISCKVSRVQDLVCVYSELSESCNYPLHLGLTEAGMGSKGIIASTAALSQLLQKGIGDTIRVSLTPEPNGSRTKEVEVAQQILQSLDIRSFKPQVSSCPGCGRTTSVFFRELASKIEGFISENMPKWKVTYPGVEKLNIAVMGCIVNGPGESKHADIGISLPGSGESPIAPVFIDGVKTNTLRGDRIVEDFQQILCNYIANKFNRSI